MCPHIFIREIVIEIIVLLILHFISFRQSPLPFVLCWIVLGQHLGVSLLPQYFHAYNH